MDSFAATDTSMDDLSMGQEDDMDVDMDVDTDIDFEEPELPAVGGVGRAKR
jgi:hypothetical protein